MDIMNINPAHITEFPNGITINGGALTLTGAGAPSTVPDFIGQFYIRDNGYIYSAKGNQNVSDWININPGP